MTEDLIVNEIGTVLKDEKGKELNLEKLGAELGKKEVGAEITGEYYEFEEGESERFFVMGLAPMNAKGKPNEKINAIRLLTKDGKLVINGDVVIRSTLEETAKNVLKNKRPFPVLIECTGTKSTPQGEYKTFKISELE